MRSDFDLPRPALTSSRLRIGASLAADVIAFAVLVTEGWLDDWRGLLMLGVIAASLFVTHADFVLGWLTRQFLKLVRYESLISAYRAAEKRASEAQGRLLLQLDHPAFTIIGTVVRQDRVALILRVAGRSGGQKLSRSDVLGVVNETRLELWGEVVVTDIEGARAYARVSNYQPNPVFWGLLEESRETSTSVPDDVVAIRMKTGE